MLAPTTLLPFQPAAMSTAQLAAVSFLARYSGRTHTLYAYQLRQWFDWCATKRAGPAGRDSARSYRAVHSPAG
jgi:integrase/recombinase XerD